MCYALCYPTYSVDSGNYATQIRCLALCVTLLKSLFVLLWVIPKTAKLKQPSTYFAKSNVSESFRVGLQNRCWAFYCRTSRKLM